MEPGSGEFKAYFYLYQYTEKCKVSKEYKLKSTYNIVRFLEGRYNCLAQYP